MARETLSILLVEDEPSIAFLERDALERSGFRVEDAATGKEALERLQRDGRFALIVLDYMLPDMTGDEMMATLGENNVSLPVVVVTGYQDPEIEKRMRGAGVRDFILKDTDLKFLDSLPQAAIAAVERATPG